MRSLAAFLPLIAVLAALAGCSEHDCKLETEEQKQTFGEIAGMTKGANTCFVALPSINAGFEMDAPAKPPLELSATHYETTVDEVAKKYESFLKEKGWEVTVQPHTGKRGNGEPYEGKMVLAKKGERQVGSIIYELTTGIIDTTIMEIPKK